MPINSKAPNVSTRSLHPSPDLLSKINNIYLAIREIKKSVSKHDSLLSELNKKLDKVSNQLRYLGTRTAALEIRMDQFESRLSNVESLKSTSDESLISEMLDSLEHVT
ncbi:hypothetical protein QTP88_013823 [Uroleucon formosanum]